MALIGQVPEGSIADEAGKVTPGWKPFFSGAQTLLSALTLSGSTANRPTKMLWLGRPYFDETLGKPIWVSAVSGGAATWIDALGGGGGVLSVALGGTGLSSGTSGGILGFTGPTTMASSALLTANALVLGGGAGATPSTPVGLGTTVTVLHGNAGGAPTWGPVVLTTDVSGTLPATSGGTGASTYTLGDTLYASAANTLSKLSGNTTSTRKFLRQTGTGVVSAAPTWDTIVAADIPGSALTKTDDTNVTLTLGGSPTTALLNAASITAGWTGQLALSRGGTAANLTAANGGVVYSGAAALAINTPGSSGDWLKSAGAAAPVWTNPAALTKSDDTNVTLTLGGSATTALLNAASLTLGWTGTLGLSRGGAGGALTASNGGIVWSDASKLNVLAGTATANQLLLSGSSAAPSWSTPTHPTAATANKAIVGDGTNWVLSTPTIPLTSSPTAGKVMIGDGTNWVASTPTYPNASATAGKVIRSDGTNFAAWSSTIPDTFSQGDMLYASAANVFSALAKSATANSFVKNSGSSNNPAWAQIAAADLTNGTTGSGSVMLAASPTTTGTLTAASLNATDIVASKGVTAKGSVTGGTNAGVHIDYGAIAASTGRIVAYDFGASAYKTLYIDGQDLLMNANGNGVVRFPAISTTASAANAFLDSGSSPANNLLRSTSSLRYKPFYKPLGIDAARSIVLDAVPIEYIHESGTPGVGLAAEWEARDRRMVTFDQFGRPDWVQYPHYVAPIMLVIQDHERRMKAANL